MRNRALALLFSVVLLPFAVRSAKSVNGESVTAPNDAAQILVGAGDIADCSDLRGAEATAKLLESIPGTVMAVGDLAYPDGTPENFVCYDETWGRVKSRTRPAVGNHEFHSTGATYYFQYFGASAGDPSKGYFSYQLGSWHILVLNSECEAIGGCGTGSNEEQWLRADLAAHPSACKLAYFHKPLFSSGGTHGDAPAFKPFWQALYEAHADIVVNGHDHNYERFGPQNPDGDADPRGIREFVVGTGGKNHRPFQATPDKNSEVRNADTFGVLKLTLRAGSYDWVFIPEAGKIFTDSGTGTCH
jgi:calcineurin-like phosphoesterase family protein